jgi:hypothetical protein
MSVKSKKLEKFDNFSEQNNDDFHMKLELSFDHVQREKQSTEKKIFSVEEKKKIETNAFNLLLKDDGLIPLYIEELKTDVNGR